MFKTGIVLLLIGMSLWIFAAVLWKKGRHIQVLESDAAANAIFWLLIIGGFLVVASVVTYWWEVLP